MKKLIILALLFLAPTGAWAQCNGKFPASTACGSVSGGPPGPVPFSAIGGGGGGAVTSVGSPSGDNTITFGGTGSGPYTGLVTGKVNQGAAYTWSGIANFTGSDWQRNGQ